MSAGTIQGVTLSGMSFVGVKNFRSIEGNIWNWNRNTQFDTVTKDWTELINDTTVLCTVSDRTYVNRVSDYILLDGAAKGGSISLKSSSANNIWGNIIAGSPCGFYAIGRITGTGTTQRFFSVQSGGTEQIRFGTTNTSGNFNLGLLRTGFGNTTGNVAMTTGALRCWRIILGENNTTNCMKFYENGTLFRQVTTNVTTTGSVPDRHVCPLVAANNTIELKRVLVYDWTGKTNAQVAALDAEVTALITELEGITF